MCRCSVYLLTSECWKWTTDKCFEIMAHLLDAVVEGVEGYEGKYAQWFENELQGQNLAYSLRYRSVGAKIHAKKIPFLSECYSECHIHARYNCTES